MSNLKKKVIFTGEIEEDTESHELFVRQFGGKFGSKDFQDALKFVGVGKDVKVLIEEE